MFSKLSKLPSNLSITHSKFFFSSFNTPKVLIIGGGPGGCVAALSLHNIGINSQIYEREDLSSFDINYSGNITLHGGALCLKYLGYDKEWKEISSAFNNAIFCDVNDTILYKINPLEMIHNSKSQTFKNHSDLIRGVPRNRLTNMLRQLCLQTEGISFYDNKQFVKYSQNKENIAAYFKDGTEASGEILLGFDGISSKVREQMILNDTNGLMDSDYRKFSGNYGWLCNGNLSDVNSNYKLLNLDTEMQLSDNSLLFFNAHKLCNEYTLGFIYNEKSKQSELRVKEDYWEEELTSEELRDFLVQNRFNSKFTPFAENVKKLLHLKLDYVNMTPRKSWNDNRAIILGDASHAVSPFGGQGCNNAIYDSIALCHLISQEQNNDLLFSQEKVNGIFRTLCENRQKEVNEALGHSNRLAKVL